MATAESSRAKTGGEAKDARTRSQSRAQLLSSLGLFDVSSISASSLGKEMLPATSSPFGTFQRPRSVLQ